MEYEGRLERLDELAALRALYLTTTGRTSGQPRTVEIWFVAHQGGLYVLAEHHHQAHWVQNIKVDPRIHIRIGNHDLDCLGRILDRTLDADSWQAVQDLATEKYGRGAGLPVQLTRVLQ